MTVTVTVQGAEFPTAAEAVSRSGVSGTEVVSVAGRFWLVTRAEGERLDRLGVVESYWDDRDGELFEMPASGGETRPPPRRDDGREPHRHWDDDNDPRIEDFLNARGL